MRRVSVKAAREDEGRQKNPSVSLCDIFDWKNVSYNEFVNLLLLQLFILVLKQELCDMDNGKLCIVILDPGKKCTVYDFNILYGLILL